MTTAAATLRERAEGLGAALPPLIVAAEHLANSVLAGAHGRRRPGPGAEFWQFRPAAETPGRIDWRRSARGDEAFVRQTEWQAARAVSLWVDPGAAMGFSGAKDRETKGARARLLALALGLLLLRGGERVGLAHPDHPPRAGRAQAGRLALAFATPPDAAEHGAPDLGATPPGGHAVLISDFLGDLAPLRSALAIAAERHLRGLIVQMLDPVEEVFPFDGRTRFESMSGHLAWETLRAGDLRAAYRARLAARKDDLQRLARHAGWQAVTLHTDQPAAAGLLWLYHALGDGARGHSAAGGRA
jgi:MoxR-like ATPase